MTASPVRRLRRFGPALVLGLVILLSGVSVWQAWNVSGHLRREARESSHIFGQVIAALSDTAPGAQTEVLLQLVGDIRATGIPLAITDTTGRATQTANLPAGLSADDPGIGAYLRHLDEAHPPIPLPGLGQIHFGNLPVTRRLRLFALLQLGLLVSAVAAGGWAYREAVRRHRDRLWVAMARESAHQLGTPLMSANAWADRLADGDSDPVEVARYLKADFERLQRVALRFERIGRPAQRDRVPLGTLAERVAAYFTPRLPRREHHVAIRVDAPAAGPFVTGDAVLLEWAIEALVRNAIDALSGRGGEIRLVLDGDERAARLAVIDDGPGVLPAIRTSLFEPGTSTKAGGWGIGLALARRIVEDVHDGALRLVPTDRGARFEATLPARSA